MSQAGTQNLITPARFDAVLFDLDGVLTKTAKLHASCWKKMFDQFLQQRAGVNKEPFKPFDIDRDYELYVDGEPRYDGVRNFLKSRGIELPYGDPDGPADADTVCGLGNRKNELVTEAMKTQGIEVYDSSVSLARTVRSEGIKTAVVSSSENCAGVLAAAGIAELFDLRLDGHDAVRFKLAGKPAPDTYLKAAERLGVEPERAVVVEDAIAGVQAGRAGGFGLVIGVDRKGDADALKENGATIVVTDLGELLQKVHE